MVGSLLGDGVLCNWDVKEGMGGYCTLPSVSIFGRGCYGDFWVRQRQKEAIHWYMGNICWSPSNKAEWERDSRVSCYCCCFFVCMVTVNKRRTIWLMVDGEWTGGSPDLMFTVIKYKTNGNHLMCGTFIQSAMLRVFSLTQKNDWTWFLSGEKDLAEPHCWCFNGFTEEQSKNFKLKLKTRQHARLMLLGGSIFSCSHMRTMGHGGTKSFYWSCTEGLTFAVHSTCSFKYFLTEKVVSKWLKLSDLKCMRTRSWNKISSPCLYSVSCKCFSKNLIRDPFKCTAKKWSFIRRNAAVLSKNSLHTA